MQIISTIFFGVEYEVLIKQTNSCKTRQDVAETFAKLAGVKTLFIDTYKDHKDKTYNRNTWIVDKNTSVDDEDDEGLITNTEIVSPILRLNELDKLKAALETLSSSSCLECTYNEYTSLHVHFSFGDYLNLNNLYNLCMSWWYAESIFALLCDRSRRNNTFCKLMHESVKAHKTEIDPQSNLDKNKKTSFRSVDDLIVFFQGGRIDVEARNMAFNMMNLRTGGTGTIEIRIKENHCDANEIVAWITLLAVYFSNVLEMNIQWTHELFEQAWRLNTYICTSKQITDEIVSEFQAHFHTIFDMIGEDALRTYWQPVFECNLRESPDLQLKHRNFDWRDVSALGTLEQKGGFCPRRRIALNKTI